MPDGHRQFDSHAVVSYYELVEFARRVPPAHKLKGAVGKSLLKKAAERYLDHDMIHRQKQGFGAPMEQWFSEGDFGKRCLAVLWHESWIAGNEDCF